jgi:hypothetical protein
MSFVELIIALRFHRVTNPPDALHEPPDPGNTVVVTVRL